MPADFDCFPVENMYGSEAIAEFGRAFYRAFGCPSRSVTPREYENACHIVSKAGGPANASRLLPSMLRFMSVVWPEGDSLGAMRHHMERFLRESGMPAGSTVDDVVVFNEFEKELIDVVGKITPEGDKILDDYLNKELGDYGKWCPTIRRYARYAEVIRRLTNNTLGELMPPKSES